MTLDADAIRSNLGDAATRLETLEVFSEIASTNSYLMQQPGPSAGSVRVAATDNQTAGRGRHGRVWQSPPGSGLCLSMAYTFSSKPDNLPAMTLAVGLGVVNALKKERVHGVQLKWPNDLVAVDSKLGGILTESQSRGGAITVVTGIGLNIDLSGHPDLSIGANWARRVTDVRRHAGLIPDINALASSLVGELSSLLADYEAGGFDQFKDQWQQHDWLRGRAVAIDSAQQQISGIGAGVAADGALLIDTPTAGVQRVTSGTVILEEFAT